MLFAKGRDRTGIVVASLMLLDADPNSVSEAYAVYQSSVSDDPAPQKETLLALVELVQQRYGSFVRMLTPPSVSPLAIRKFVQIFRGDR